MYFDQENRSEEAYGDDYIVSGDSSDPCWVERGLLVSESKEGEGGSR